MTDREQIVATQFLECGAAVAACISAPPLHKQLLLEASIIFPV